MLPIAHGRQSTGRKVHKVMVMIVSTLLCLYRPLDGVADALVNVSATLRGRALLSQVSPSATSRRASRSQSWSRSRGLGSSACDALGLEGGDGCADAAGVGDGIGGAIVAAGEEAVPDGMCTASGR